MARLAGPDSPWSTWLGATLNQPLATQYDPDQSFVPQLYGFQAWDDFTAPQFSAWPANCTSSSTGGACSVPGACLVAAGPDGVTLPGSEGWLSAPCDSARPFTCKVFLRGEFISASLAILPLYSGGRVFWGWQYLCRFQRVRAALHSTCSYVCMLKLMLNRASRTVNGTAT